MLDLPFSASSTCAHRRLTPREAADAPGQRQFAELPEARRDAPRKSRLQGVTVFRFELLRLSGHTPHVLEDMPLEDLWDRHLVAIEVAHRDADRGNALCKRPEHVRRDARLAGATDPDERCPPAVADGTGQIARPPWWHSVPSCRSERDKPNSGTRYVG